MTVEQQCKRFFGRRSGRKLRPAQHRRLEELLPKYLLSADDDLSRKIPAQYQEIWLEIGFGGGEHLAWQAKMNPHILCLGVEPFRNGVAQLLRYIEEGALENIRIFPDQVQALLPSLPAGSLHRIFVLFPDPWPKKRHAMRRVIQPAILDAFCRLLVKGGGLHLASDDPVMIDWMLRQMQNTQNFEWLAESPQDWQEGYGKPPVTRYQKKAQKAGRSCCFFHYRYAISQLPDETG